MSALVSNLRGVYKIYSNQAKMILEFYIQFHKRRIYNHIISNLTN
jgi:hypothetical protein